MDFIIKQENLEFTIEYAGQPGLPGQKGDPGEDGLNGKSAFEIAQEQGFVGTKDQWLESLKGVAGEDGQDGTNGLNGKSAFEIAQEQGFIGTKEQWLESLKGVAGEDGQDGTNGLNGESATVSIGTVNTVAPNQNANIINVGTESQVILDFYIPKGMPGDASEIENIGTGVGVFKGVDNNISQLKTLKTLSNIISIISNTNTIDVNISNTNLTNYIEMTIQDVYDDLISLKNRVDNLESDTIRIDNDIDIINEQISTININISSLQSYLQSQISNNYIELVNLKSTVVALEVSILNFNNSIITINNDINILKSRVTATENNIASNTSAINTANTNITNNTNSINTANTNISTNITDINNLKSSVINPESQYVHKYAFSNATTSSAFNNLAFSGYYATSQNGFDYSQLPTSYVLGKEYYYYPSKSYYKDANSPSNGSSIGYIFNDATVLANDFKLVYKVGQLTSNDANSNLFCGLIERDFTASSVNLSNVLTANNNNISAIGFGFAKGDTNYQFFIKKKATASVFKLNLSNFSGNFSGTDILARSIETPMQFVIKLNSLKNGLDLSFENCKTNTVGTYSLLFSTVTNMPSITNNFFSICHLYSQQTGYNGTADFLAFFKHDLTRDLG